MLLIFYRSSHRWRWWGLLRELKMLDLSRLLPGPYCSLLLADLGMEILKVEDTEQGDYTRAMGPIRKKDSAIFLALNRNKKSIKLNLKVREGKEIFYKLIQSHLPWRFRR